MAMFLSTPCDIGTGNGGVVPDIPVTFSMPIEGKVVRSASRVSLSTVLVDMVAGCSVSNKSASTYKII